MIEEDQDSEEEAGGKETAVFLFKIVFLLKASEALCPCLGKLLAILLATFATAKHRSRQLGPYARFKGGLPESLIVVAYAGSRASCKRGISCILLTINFQGLEPVNVEHWWKVSALEYSVG